HLAPPLWRCSDSSDGFHQRPNKQGQTDPPLQRRCRPGSWPLHGGAILRDKEVGLYWPPMPVSHPTLLTGQLRGRGAHQQRFVVGRVINPHHIQADVGIPLIVQQMPPPQPDEPRLARDVPIHVGRHLRERAPRMQHRAVHRATPGFACRWGGAQRSLTLMRKRPSRASCAVAAANCSWVAMPASTTSSRLPWTGGKSSNTRATASAQLAPKRVRRTRPTRTPSIITTVVRAATRLARTARPARWQYALPAKAR